MRRTISQREARTLQKRVAELEGILERQQNRWASDWPMGTHLGWIEPTNQRLTGHIEAARLLKHAVVCTLTHDGNRINFHALPIARKP